MTSITNTTLLVSFEEPTSLLGVPILYYSIVVITVYTMDIISTTNSTKTTVYLDLDRVHICSQLEVMVSGWNEVGEGHIAKISALLSDGIPVLCSSSFIHRIVMYRMYLYVGIYACI